jgi:hypothetical protein
MLMDLDGELKPCRVGLVGGVGGYTVRLSGL